DGTFHIAGVDDVDGSQVHAKRLRRGLEDAELSERGGIGRVAKHPRTFQVGNDLLEHLQPFRADRVLKQSKSRGVATWPCQAVHKASADWVGYVAEHDWQSAGGPLQRCDA